MAGLDAIILRAGIYKWIQLFNIMYTGWSATEKVAPNIGFTAIYRIVALASGVGKTSLGEEVVEILTRRGVQVAVIKQTHERFADEFSDAARYKMAGARIVVVSSPGETIIYREPMTGLREIIYTIRYFPIVIAEGFQRSNIGKAIVIVETMEELSEALSVIPGVWFIVSRDFDVVEEARKRGYHALLFDETEALAGEIYKDAVATLASLLPEKSEEGCEYCGAGSCIEFIEKLLHGLKKPYECPFMAPVRLIIEDKPVQLDPQLQNVLKNIVEGFIEALRGLPENPRKVRIELELQPR